MTIETKFDLDDTVTIKETGEIVRILEIEAVRANGLYCDLYRVSNGTWGDQYLDHQLVKYEKTT